MATSQEIPASPRATHTHWLWIARILAVLSIVSIAALIVVSWPGYFEPAVLILALPPAIPYLWILWRLSGDKKKKGLALAVVIGSVAFLYALPILEAIVTSLCGIHPLRMASAGLWALAQIALVLSSIMAQRALPLREERPTFGREVFGRALYIGLPLLILGAIAIPNLLRSRMAGDGSPVGDIRTINTAEITYASTYNAGYSPSLAELGPPPAGSMPSASAAGLVDSMLASGVKRGYRIEYQPGPAENGRIDIYTLTSRPIRYGCRGMTGSYFTDQSGVIRWTDESCPATVHDPPLPQ